MPVPASPDGVAIVGTGYTKLTRTPERSEVALGVEACRMAAEDAGLSAADIDGICIQVHHYPPPETKAIARGLRMKEVNWLSDGGPEGTIGIGAVGMATQILDSGQCKAVAVCKIMNTVAPVSTPEIDSTTGEVSGEVQFEVPYGLGYTMQRTGLFVRRWMHRYGVKEEQIGSVAIVEREHAIEHPYAYQKKPLTMADYLSSRWIAEPVRLLDCDIPINGACAFLMVRGALARTLRHPPIYVAGWASSESTIPDHLAPELSDGLAPVAQTIYRDTGMSPKDMDMAFPYDGFSFFAPMWLESLGVVPRGEAGNFVDGGDRIRRTGQLPMNTHGGNLAGGRMHGQGHVLEAVEQLRGTAGPRQASKPVNLAVLSAGFPISFRHHAGILGRDI